MSNLLKATLLALAVVALPQAYAAKTHVSDSQIVSDVKAKIAADKMTSDLKVDVTSKNGDISLAGNINTDEEASKLIELASSVPGADDVNSSKLKVKDSKHPFTDAALTAKVKGAFIREKLFGDKEVALMGITVETTNGVVYLTGVADNQAQANTAASLAKSVKGVKNVISKVEIKPEDQSN